MMRAPCRIAGLFWLMVVTILLTCPAHAGNDFEPPVIRPGVERAIATDGHARVLIKLRPDFPSTQQGLSQADIRDLHSRFGNTLTAETRTGDFEEKHRMVTIPWVSARISRAVLQKLRDHANVAIIEEDIPIHALLAESAPLIGADRSWDLGVTGAGINVAILDTGIDTDHPDLQNSLAWEECFLSGARCPGSTTGRASGDGSAEDGHGHGTHVAGIITSDNTTHRGVAPDAGIVAIKVLDDSGSGLMSDIEHGLDWVAANYAAYDIGIVNMSLGSGVSYGYACDNEYTSMSEVVAQVRSKGVMLFAASGNDGEDSGINMPACLSNVVSVGSVYDDNVGALNYSVCSETETAADQITCFSNVSDNLDLLAPGAIIVSSKTGGGSISMSGTSMAAPHAAAVAALLLEANSDQSPDEIIDLMTETGATVYDDRLGEEGWLPRVDAETAVLFALADLDKDANVDGADLAGLAATPTQLRAKALAMVFGQLR